MAIVLLNKVSFSLLEGGKYVQGLVSTLKECKLY